MSNKNDTPQRRRIAVIGATGFVGSHLVPLLVERGHRVIAISRSGRRLSGWTDAVEARRGNVESDGGLNGALDGADAVVHLVAIPRESRGRSFDEINDRGARRAVAAAEAAEIRRFVHLSALGVTEDPYYEFLSSKWRGEQAVRASSLDWVVLRPSLLFGEGDGFFNLIKVTLTWWSPGAVAIPGDGSTRFQPLSVDDLALAIERSIVEDERPGSVYEIGGPEYMTYRQIVDRVMQATGKRRLKLNVPIPLISAATWVTDRLIPFFPVSHEQIRSLGRPNYAEPDSFERAVGLLPRPLDLAYLRR